MAENMINFRMFLCLLDKYKYFILVRSKTPKRLLGQTMFLLFLFSIYLFILVCLAFNS